MTHGHRWRSLTTKVARNDVGTWSWSVKVRYDNDAGPSKWGGTRERREDALAAVAERIARLASER